MSFNISSEHYLTLRAAAAELPGHPHVSTIHRWRLRGVRGIRLATVVIGGRRYVTRAALAEFVRRTTQARDGDAAMRSGQHDGRQHAIETARRALDEAGI